MSSAKIGAIDFAGLEAAIDRKLAENYELRRQILDLKDLIRDLAYELESEVNERYHGPDDVHPGIRHKYDRDMATVNAARLAIQPGATPAPREGEETKP